MADYKLHCFAQSGHSYKAALMLALCGVDWEPVFVDFFNGGARDNDFLSVNPMGECPVLVTPDAGTLTQSGVMLDYLARRTGKFGPDDEAEFREILRWVLWENHKLNSFQGIYRFMLNFAPEKARSEDVTRFAKGRAMAALTVLNDHLEGREWIAASRPTVADVACSGYVFYPREEYGWTEEERWPHVEAWMDRVKALPGWAHPYDLMPGHPLPQNS